MGKSSVSPVSCTDPRADKSTPGESGNARVPDEALNPSQLWRRLRGLPRDQHGGALLEFTIVVPLLLALCFGMIQYGVALYALNNMHDAAREGARRVAVGTATSTAQSAATAMLVPWLQSPAPSVACVDPVPGNPTQVQCTVSVPRSQAGIISFVPMSGSFTAVVTMRKEDL